MGFTLDNYTLLYIIIALFIVQLLITRYYVISTVEASEHTNNKRIVRKLSGQINSTFDQYMGGHNDNQEKQVPMRVQRRSKHEIDSIEDPAEDYDENNIQDEQDDRDEDDERRESED